MPRSYLEGYRPTYRIVNGTMSAQQTDLLLKILPETMTFSPKVYITYIGPPRNAYSCTITILTLVYTCETWAEALGIARVGQCTLTQ